MLIKGSFGIAQLTSEVAFFGFGSMSSLISETNVVFFKKKTFSTISSHESKEI